MSALRRRYGSSEPSYLCSLMLLVMRPAMSTAVMPSSPVIFRRNGAAGADGVAKVFEFGFDGFAVLDGEVFIFDVVLVVDLHEIGDAAFGNFLAHMGQLLFVGGLGDDRAGLFLVINGGISAGEKSRILRSVRKARREAVRLATQPLSKVMRALAEILVLADDRDADRTHLHHRTPDEVIDDIDIVDHHVQYDADIDGTERHRAYAAALR